MRGKERGKGYEGREKERNWTKEMGEKHSLPKLISGYGLGRRTGAMFIYLSIMNSYTMYTRKSV